MHFEGNVKINAPRVKVWEFLTDPNAVSQCVPGLETIEITEPTKKFRATASVGLGNIKTHGTVDAEWLEMDAPNIAKMKAHGTAPGSAVDILSEMVLVDADDSGTLLNWSAEITVLGTIASLASRMMGGVTKKLTNDFFECVRSKIEE